MHFPRSPRPRGFTLIELLTVIAIIAILMGLLFPVIGMVREQMRRTQAKNDLGQIVTALKQYQTEYGKFPSVGNASGDADTLVGGTAAGATVDNGALFDTLRAIDRGVNEGNRQNPRRIVFLEGRAATNADEPRAGFGDHAGAKKPGCWFDPWGGQYAVTFDSNYDQRLTLAEQYRDFSAEAAPRLAVGAFSLGRDGKLGTNDDRQFKKGSAASDDVISWQ